MHNALIFLLSLATKDVPPAPEPPKVTLSAELGLASLADIDEALARPMDQSWEITLADKSKRTIKSCKDLLAVAKSSFDLPTEDDWGNYWSQGARCFALDALRSAKPAPRSELGWFKLSAAGIAKLSPRLAMSVSPDGLEEAKKAETACQPWGKYDGTLKVRMEKGVDKARLRSEGWTGRLTLYARGDLDGDGLEDLLLRRDGHVAGGSASDTTVFIVTQTSPKGCTHVVRSMGSPDLSAETSAAP